MASNQDAEICPPKVKELIDQIIIKINMDGTNLIGRNFGISKPNYEIASLEEYVNQDNSKYFLIESEFADSYAGHIYILLHLKDAIKIGGTLLGSDDYEIKENIQKEELNIDYLDGINEFGNQFTGVLDNGFRGKLPKPMHIKLSTCTALDKNNMKEILENRCDVDCLHLSSLLLIKGFETGKFNMFISLDLVEDFFGEEIHEKVTNVLVIDTSSNDIQTAKRYLANTEFKVLPAKEVNDAFTILNKEKIHLIIIDLTLQDESGINACRHIKKTPYTKGIPVIMVSNSPTEATVIESLEAGARDFIVKPFSKDILLRKIVRYKSKKKQSALFY